MLISGGMGLAVLGLQQSSVWGWGSADRPGSASPPASPCSSPSSSTSCAIEYPLIQIRTFTDRAFAVDNAILFLLMIPFIPLFFFASMYAQISLGESASETGLYLLIFFAGFVIASQCGGRILDRVGARPAVVLGCAVAAVGFALWAHSMPDLSVSSQWPFIVLAGAGVGLVLSPANTDALNRVPRSRYGEATGITQTVRNFGSSLGLAVLGTVLILAEQVEPGVDRWAPRACRRRQADEIADSISQGSGGSEAASPNRRRARQASSPAVQHDFALASRTVFYAMAGVMAVAFVVALIWMPSGKVERAGATSPSERLSLTAVQRLRSHDRRSAMHLRSSAGTLAA